MISWAIGAAIESEVFDQVIVSTDDAEIAEVARAAGAVVPRLRPVELSDDFATLDAVVRHGLEDFAIPGDLCLVYATSAGLRTRRLIEAAELFESAPEVSFVMGVTPYPHPIQRAVRLDGGRVEMIDPENAARRTQDLPERYHDAAQFVFGRRQAWLSGQTVWTAPTLGVVIPADEGVDIDTEDDWRRAERLMQLRLEAGE